MLMLYIAQSCSTVKVVISTALYCKHWSYSPGERSKLCKWVVSSLVCRFYPYNWDWIPVHRKCQIWYFIGHLQLINLTNQTHILNKVGHKTSLHATFLLDTKKTKWQHLQTYQEIKYNVYEALQYGKLLWYHRASKIEQHIIFCNEMTGR